MSLRKKTRATESTQTAWGEITARMIAAMEARGRRAVFLFSSSEPGEGKTTIATRVAQAAAAAGRQVILATVDAVDTPARANDVPSVADLLAGRATLTPTSGKPARLRVPATLTDLPANARQPGTWNSDCDILIDGPPLGTFTTQLLMPLVDGVVLVVDARSARLKSVVRARERILAACGSFVGAVLNRHRSHMPGWVQRMVLNA